MDRKKTNCRDIQLGEWDNFRTILLKTHGKNAATKEIYFAFIDAIDNAYEEGKKAAKSKSLSDSIAAIEELKDNVPDRPNANRLEIIKENEILEKAINAVNERKIMREEEARKPMDAELRDRAKGRGDFLGDDLSGVHTCHAECPCRLSDEPPAKGETR